MESINQTVDQDTNEKEGGDVKVLLNNDEKGNEHDKNDDEVRFMEGNSNL